MEYYLTEYGVSDGFKWAIAGRSQAKLEAVKQGLAAKFPDAAVRMRGCESWVGRGVVLWFRRTRDA